MQTERERKEKMVLQVVVVTSFVCDRVDLNELTVAEIHDLAGQAHDLAAKLGDLEKGFHVVPGLKGGAVGPITTPPTGGSCEHNARSD